MFLVRHIVRRQIQTSQFKPFRFYTTQKQPEKQPEKQPITELRDGINQLRASLSSIPYIKEYHEVMDEMKRKRINTTRIKILIGLVGAGVVYTSYDLITNWASEQATVITTKSLEDPEFKKSAVIFCEDVVDQLVKSPRIQEDLTNLLELAVEDLAKREKVQNELADLFAYVFTTETVKNGGAILSADVVEQLLKGPEYKPIRQVFYDYLLAEFTNVAHDERFQEEVANLATGGLKKMIGY